MEFHSSGALKMHKSRNHVKKELEPASPVPTIQYTKFSPSKMVSDPCVVLKERLREWDDVYSELPKLEFVEKMEPLKEADVLRDFVNRHDGDRELIRHMVCHPDSRVFGELIYFIFPYGCVCSCNILKHLNPSTRPIPPEEQKHMHYIVMLNQLLLDKNIKTHYMNNRTDALNTTFMVIKSKMHFLNSILYVMGRRSSSTVGCHNGNHGLSEEDKEDIRISIQSQDDTFQYSEEELRRQKAYMSGMMEWDLNTEEFETVSVDPPKERKRWTRWAERFSDAKRNPPRSLHPYFWDNNPERKEIIYGSQFSVSESLYKQCESQYSDM